MQEYDFTAGGIKFEKFRGKAMYYVTDHSSKAVDRVAATKAVSQKTKMRKERYQMVDVWIQRDVDGWDLLWLEPRKNADKMIAVVRR